jgi:hypothetical protein
METVLWGHPEREVPFCIKQYRILDDAGNVLADIRDNHQAQNKIRLNRPVTVRQLRIENLTTGTDIPPAVFAIHCFGRTGKAE